MVKNLSKRNKILSEKELEEIVNRFSDISDDDDSSGSNDKDISSKKIQKKRTHQIIQILVC